MRFYHIVKLLNSDKLFGISTNDEKQSMKECISSWIYAPYILISNKLSIDIAFILNNNLAVINTVDEKLIIAFILELETNMLSTEQGISINSHPYEAYLIL